MNIKTHVEKAIERTGGPIPERLPPSLIYPAIVYAAPIERKVRLSIARLTVIIWIGAVLMMLTGLYVMHRGGWKSLLASLSWPSITIVREIYHTNEVFTQSSATVDLKPYIKELYIWTNTIKNNYVTNLYTTNWFITR